MIYRQIFAQKSCQKNEDFCTRFCSHKNCPKGRGDSKKTKIFVQDFVPIRTARRGGGIASSSFILFFYLLYWYYSYIVYFVCAPASEFGAMGFTSFLGFSYPNLLLVFLNLLFLRNLYHIFLAASVGTLFGSFFFYRYFSNHILG